MAEETLSEEDTKRLYITRAIEGAGWKDHEINMEFTAGRISVDSKGRAHRGDKLILFTQIQILLVLTFLIKLHLKL